MNKEEVITRVRTERSRWNDIIAQINDDLMLKPGVEGDWSARDILAHVIWYEREIVGLLRARAFVGSDLWALPLDERNAGVHEETRSMTLEEVRAESERVFPDLLEQLEALPEDAYGDPSSFPGMPAEWEPWYIIAGNTFNHYPDHIESLRQLLE
ncbi:MAG: DinB family protein [Chloroflexota bacterium]|nr:DinB family protein [Chloroflexota bacterium]MDE2942326.1 DinB family protein [Chloroflexota bacterium]MDE3268269.1 DinB family protein [Chloroflexota bacterium]